MLVIYQRSAVYRHNDAMGVGTCKGAQINDRARNIRGHADAAKQAVCSQVVAVFLENRRRHLTGEEARCDRVHSDVFRSKLLRQVFGEVMHCRLAGGIGVSACPMNGWHVQPIDRPDIYNPSRLCMTCARMEQWG